MADEDIRKLAQAIEDYAKWVKGTSKTTSYPQTLMDFLLFAINNGMAWKDMFTVDTLEAFRSHSRFTVAPRALVSLSDYLFSQNIKIFWPKKGRLILGIRSGWCYSYFGKIPLFCRK